MGPIASISTSNNLTNQQQSRFDEGISVVRSLLQPESATYQAMTEEQRQGLQKVEQLLLEGVDGGVGTMKATAMSHIPTELIRMESESSTTNTSYKFIIKEFGGVQEKTALRKVRTALIAHAWARKALSKSVRRIAGENTISRMRGRRSLDNADIAGFYAPPEFTSLSKDQQFKLCDMLSWEKLKRWDYDIFYLTKLCNGHPLLFVGWAILASPHSQTAMKVACGFPLDCESTFDGNASPNMADHERTENMNFSSDRNGGCGDSEECSRPSSEIANSYLNSNRHQGYNFCDTLKIPQETLCDYLRVIEKDYNSENPYHNEIHGADVIQTVHSLLQMNLRSQAAVFPISNQTQSDGEYNSAIDSPKEGVPFHRPKQFGEDCSIANASCLTVQPLECFAVLLAAAVHDVGHPGRNNSFQINRQTNLALEYNDLSVLENMHASKAFRRMFESHCYVGSTSSACVVSSKRSTVKNPSSSSSLSALPIADSPSTSQVPSSHVPLMKLPSAFSDSSAEIDDMVDDKRPSYGKQEPFNILRNMETEQMVDVRRMIIDAILHTDMSKHFVSVSKMRGMVLSALQQFQPLHERSAGDNCATGARSSPNIAGSLKDGNPWKVLCYLLHLADISNPAKPRPMLQEWTRRCLEEFFSQGDEEARLGLPMSPNCDRNATKRADSQIGFIKFVILPAYEVLAEIIPAVGDVVLPVILSNLEYWTEMQAAEEAVAAAPKVGANDFFSHLKRKDNQD